MPEISRFYGISIHIYYSDHNPPHFHACYGKQEALFSIETLQIIEGRLPKKAVLLVLEWASKYRKELLEDWELASNEKMPKKIKPLR